MTTIQTKPVHDPARFGFEAHASEVSLHVRQALAAVCTHLGVESAKPRLFARQMGWNKNLAWKISRIVTGEDLLAAIPLLPGRAGQQTMLKTFAAAGVPPASIEAVRSALAEFEAMVVTHAGDRDTFQKMLADLTDVGQGDRDEAHRKLAFEGNSAFWGVQARTRLSCNIIWPGATEEHLDWATVSGMTDFRRLRSNTEWTITSIGMIDDTGEEMQGRSREPMDPTIPGSHALPILRAYCSDPLPPLRAVPANAGRTYYRIADGPVGTMGQFTCLLGWIQRGLVTRWRTDQDGYSEYVVSVSTPVELLHFDMFFHKSLDFAMNPEARLHSLLPDEPRFVDEAQHPGTTSRAVLPMVERLTNVPTSPLDATAAEMPEYAGMVKWMFERIGQDPAEFRGFRFRQRYPMLSTQLAFRHDKPARP